MGLGGAWAQTAAVAWDQVKTQKRLHDGAQEAPHRHMQGAEGPEMNPPGTPADFQHGHQDRSMGKEKSFQQAALGRLDPRAAE